MNKKPIGIVMCGGQSSRMGSDKGLLKKNGDYWFQVSLSKIVPFISSYYISINSGQLESYSRKISPNHLIVDSSAVEGPLKGLLSAHTLMPENDFLVLACDMVDMKEKILKKLIHEYNSKKNNFEAYCFRNKTFFEPLCSIYTAKGLHKIHKETESGSIQSFSMQSILNKLRTYAIPIQEDETIFFKNYNFPA